MKREMYVLISGIMVGLSWVISLFFLRFWRQSEDRFFAFFSISFALLGFERLVLALFVFPNESQPVVYLIRLLAFCLIALGIIDKNRVETKK